MPTLATELAGRGWQTGAVIGNFVLRRASGLARGFDVFDDDLPQREAVRRWPERIGPLTTQAALRMLQDCDVSRRARCSPRAGAGRLTRLGVVAAAHNHAAFIGPVAGGDRDPA